MTRRRNDPATCRHGATAIKDITVLQTIFRAPGNEISGVDLAMQLYVTPDTYWRAMERNEAYGHVERFERDGKAWFRLTDAGRFCASPWSRSNRRHARTIVTAP